MARVLCAEWPGRCPECGGRFPKGADIRQGPKGWGHDVCPEKATPANIGETVMGAALAANVAERTTGQTAAQAVNAAVGGSYADKWRDFKPSVYQVALRTAFIETDHHLVVKAVAGSGKTTSLCWLLSTVPSQGRVIYMAFNKSIAAELSRKLPGCVESSTLNAAGHRLCSHVLKRKLEPTEGLGRVYRSLWTVDDTDIGRANRALEPTVIQMCGLVRGALLEPSQANLALLASRHDVEGYYAEPSEVQMRVSALLTEHVRQARETPKGAGAAPALICDFDSQIWLPFALGLKPLLTYDVVLVDEAQDLNAAQHDLVLRLAGESGRVVAIGDKHQCVVSNTIVTALRGGKKVSVRAGEVVEGDMLASGNGSGGVVFRKVLRVHRKSYQGQAVEVETKGGRKLLTTAEHVYFADYNLGNMDGFTDRFFVYLMKKGKNYRIGKTRCFRNESRGELSLGFEARARQEGADAAWLLMTCGTDAEARYWETVLSLRYQIPQTVFKEVSAQDTDFRQQETIDAIFNYFDTWASARKLLEFCAMSELYPHWTPKCMTSSRRRNFNITMLGQVQGNKVAHRYSISGSDMEDAQRLKDVGLRVRKAKGSSGWRIESSNLSLEAIHAIREKVEETLKEVNVIETAKLTQTGKALPFMPASHVREGMSVYVQDGDQIVYDQVIRYGIGTYTGEVCDFDIEETHNYCAGGIFTHNSIYGFRGASVTSMDDMTSALRGHDERGVQELPLSVCYRCPTKVVKLVQLLGYCPGIEAAEGAPEGEVFARDEGEMVALVREAAKTAGGAEEWSRVAVLSPLNAPLFPGVLRLIREGIPATVQGRDDSKKLRGVIDRIRRKCADQSITTFLRHLTDARSVAVAKAMARNEPVEPVCDVYDSLAALSDGPDVATIRDLESFIDKVFVRVDLKADDRPNAVVFSTVHRFKGQERPHILVLRPDALPFPWARQEWEQQQARNLAYVAFTRAQARLVFLTTKQAGLHPNTASALAKLNGPPPPPASFDPPEGMLPPINELGGLPPLDYSEPEPEAHDEPEETSTEEMDVSEAPPATSGPLPTHPAKGNGVYTPPTMEDWKALATEYAAAGCQAELCRPTGWRQMALLVQRGARMVRVSTTVNDGANGARAKGANAIDITLVESRDGFPVGGQQKVLRTSGWQGRVCERINRLLGGGR